MDAQFTDADAEAGGRTRPAAVDADNGAAAEFHPTPLRVSSLE